MGAGALRCDIPTPADIAGRVSYTKLKLAARDNPPPFGDAPLTECLWVQLEFDGLFFAGLEEELSEGLQLLRRFAGGTRKPDIHLDHIASCMGANILYPHADLRSAAWNGYRAKSLNRELRVREAVSKLKQGPLPACIPVPIADKQAFVKMCCVECAIRFGCTGILAGFCSGALGLVCGEGDRQFAAW